MESIIKRGHPCIICKCNNTSDLTIQLQGGILSKSISNIRNTTLEHWAAKIPERCVQCVSGSLCGADTCWIKRFLERYLAEFTITRYSRLIPECFLMITKYLRLSSIKQQSRCRGHSLVSTTWWFLAADRCLGIWHLSSLRLAFPCQYRAFQLNTWGNKLLQCLSTLEYTLSLLWADLSPASEISVTPSKSHQLAVTDRIRCLVGLKLFPISTKRSSWI